MEQVDIEQAFREHLPHSSFNPNTFEEKVEPDPTSSEWKPPGSMLHSFELQGKKYEIWTTSLANPVSLQMWKNMQVLVMLFIDGASPLELDEDWTYERWSLHLLYEVASLEDSSVSPYTIAGFSTSHRYWIFPTRDILRATHLLPSPPESTNGDASPEPLPRLKLSENTESELFVEHIDPLQCPCRERISQFLILPPYQGQSLGSRLYETIFNHYHKQSNVYEIPVEDPNEEFDVMRDFSDIQYLRKIPEFANLSLATSLPPDSFRKKEPVARDLILGNGADLNALRRKAKIVPRQFNRMVELHLLSTIPPAHRNRARLTRKEKSSNVEDRKYFFWRLALKARIWRQSADVLEELAKDDPQQAIEKVEDAVDKQQDEFQERLEGLERRLRWTSASADEDGGEVVPRRTMKRSRVVIEEDDESDVASTSSKKPKV